MNIEKDGRFEMIAKTMFGLEDVLAKEIEEIGGEDIKKLNRAVRFYGDMNTLYKANYLCRTAISILRPIYSFEANNEHELYDNVLKFRWERLINPDGTFFIDNVVFSKIFTHSLYASYKTKDAICDRLRKMFGMRPSIDKEKPDIILNLHINENKVNISLDSSGESLHKRNYRIATGPAPINEIVAAGLIQLAEWDRKTNFYDPMCGSGTLLIEAAMYASNIPAQYYRRKFAFMNWPEFSMPEWRKVKEDANREIKEFDYEIWGSDVSGNFVKVAEENIRNAKLHNDIKVYRASIEEAELPEGETLIITNPPYGERMETRDIQELYSAIGDVLKTNFTGNTAWIISSDFDALKHIGLRTSRRLTVYNSNLECKFYKYELYEGSKKASKQDGEDQHINNI